MRILAAGESTGAARSMGRLEGGAKGADVSGFHPQMCRGGDLPGTESSQKMGQGTTELAWLLERSGEVCCGPSVKLTGPANTIMTLKKAREGPGRSHFIPSADGTLTYIQSPAGLALNLELKHF